MADRALSNHSAVMIGRPLSWCICFCLWMRSARSLGSLFMSCFNLEARCRKAESANLRMSCGTSDQGKSQDMLSILTGLRSKMEGRPSSLTSPSVTVMSSLLWGSRAYSTSHRGWSSSCLAHALPRGSQNKERDGLYSHAVRPRPRLKHLKSRQDNIFKIRI